MTVEFTTTLTCDHTGCDSYIKGGSADTTAQAARDAGWHCAEYDYCPSHNPQREAAE